MSKASEELSKVRVVDEHGQSVEVQSLWRERPTVIMWIRHFGCMACAAQVDEFKPHIQALRACGIGFSIIGSGTPNFVEGFKERMGIDAPVFSDAKLASYQALKMKRGLFTMIDPRIVKNWIIPFKYRQRRTMGDALQQGGVLVVTPEGEVTYEYKSEYAGDHPKPSVIVEAALAAKTLAKAS
jgi:peroxiredoxin